MATDRPLDLTLYPAIDLRRGRCVRLEQGAADRETQYDPDPFRVGRDFAEQGAEWVHIVDLDAAFGEGSNRELIAELAGTLPLRVQAGGGLRTRDDLERVLEGPVQRVVVGTAAIENPDLVRWAVGRWGSERLAVGLDARGRRPAVRGWREESEADLLEIGSGLAELGVRTFIYTDIERDGMFSGPNLETSEELAGATGARVIVSGGVGGMEHIDAVADAGRRNDGIAGAIVGKALYEGRVVLREAIQRLKGQR